MGKKMNAVQVSRIAGMLPKKAVLAVAVAGALFTAGQVTAAPIALKWATQRASISTQANDSGTQATLWTVDAMGNPSTDNSDKIVKIMAGTKTANLTIPKGASSVDFTIGMNASARLDVTGLSGDVALNAELDLGTNTITGSSSLKITADALQGMLGGTFTDGTPAGTMLSPAFTTSTLGGASTAGAKVKVTHVTGGVGSVPAEIIPSTTADATGALALTFTNASGNITTPSSEYYVLSDVTGVLADAVVANVGNNAVSDIVMGAAKSVIMTDASGNEISAITASATTGGFAVDLAAQSYLVLDAYGNVVTPATATISGAVSEVVGTGTYAAGVVSYASTFAGSQDNLTVSFSEPAGASLMLDVLAPDVDPLLDDISMQDDTADTGLGELTPGDFFSESDMEIRGGTAVNGGLYQVVAYGKEANTLATRFAVKPDSADVGKAVDYKLLLGWFGPTGEVIYFDFGTDPGEAGGEPWDFDLSSLGVFSSVPAADAGLTTILDLNPADFFYDAFPAGSLFMWITGYELADDGNADADTLRLGAAWLVNK